MEANIGRGVIDHEVVVKEDVFWLFGGYVSGSRKNDIWQSSNGVDWTEVMAGSHWSARSGHEVVVKEDVFWLFGGYDGGEWGL